MWAEDLTPGAEPAFTSSGIKLRWCRKRGFAGLFVCVKAVKSTVWSLRLTNRHHVEGSNPFDYCDWFYVHVQNRSVTINWLRWERGMRCCHLSARFFISFVLRLSSTAALLLCFFHNVQHVSPACWQETPQDTWPMWTVWIMFKTQLWSSLLDGKVVTLLLYFLYLILVTCVGK